MAIMNKITNIIIRNFFRLLFFGVPILIIVLFYIPSTLKEYSNYQLTQNPTCQITSIHNDEIDLEIVHIYSRRGVITINVHYPKQSISFRQDTHKSLVQYVEKAKNIKQFRNTGHYKISNAIIYQCKVNKKTKYFLYEATINDNLGNIIYPKIKFAWNTDDQKYALKAFRRELMGNIFGSFAVIFAMLYAKYRLKQLEIKI